MMRGYVDIFQVGARNMQNYYLLRALGEVRKPVLLKRGMSATMEELLMSAEYILAGGNWNVILCERGIRTFETYTRNTFDIAAIPVDQETFALAHVGDPSHGTGRRDKVRPMARAAVAAGADGLLIEVHNDPDHALSDGAQSLEPGQFAQLMDELRIIAPRSAASSPDMPADDSPHSPRRHLGTGLIGGSFALALRKYTTDIHITGWDRPDVARAAEPVAPSTKRFLVNLPRPCVLPT